MCGICGVVQVGGRPRRPCLESTLDVDDGRDDASRPERPRHVHGGRRRARCPATEHRRRRGRPSAGLNERGDVVGDPERRALQPRATCGSSSSATGTRSAPAATRRSCPISTSASATSFPAKLRGMFGVAVWDERRRRAVLARDRLGIKPLYYAQADDLLVFASELKSLLASGLIEPELDYEAIDAYLTFGFVPGPEHAIAGSVEADAGPRARGRGRRSSGRSSSGGTREPNVGTRLSDEEYREQRGREARRVRPSAADERRPARSDAERRPRLEPDRRA